MRRRREFECNADQFIYHCNRPSKLVVVAVVVVVVVVVIVVVVVVVVVVEVGTSPGSTWGRGKVTPFWIEAT